MPEEELNLSWDLLSASEGLANETNFYLSTLASDSALDLDFQLLGKPKDNDNIKGLCRVIRNTIDSRIPEKSGISLLLLWEVTLEYLNLKPEELRTAEKLLPHLEDVYQKLASYKNQPKEELARLRDFCIILAKQHMAKRARYLGRYAFA